MDELGLSPSETVTTDLGAAGAGAGGARRADRGEKGLASSEIPSDQLYASLKRAQRQLEFLSIQEEYIKDEMKNLKRELIRAREVRATGARGRREGEGARRTTLTRSRSGAFERGMRPPPAGAHGVRARATRGSQTRRS